MQQPILIVGGGLAGMVQALDFASAGMPSTLIESGRFVAQKSPGYDGRTSFLSLGNQRMLARIGAWKALAVHAAPVKEIRIVDADSPLFLHYDHQDVGVEQMGYIVENHHFRSALVDSILASQTITRLEGVKVERAQADAQWHTVFLSDGTQLRAKLVIAADGKDSPLRQAAGIGTRGHAYHQSAIVCAVRHTLPHHHIAIERFLPSGPFAVLPMANPNISAIVWSEAETLAPHFMAMPEADFVEALQHRFGGYLGTLELVSPRWVYPLSLRFANRLFGPRLGLIGDAAHFIHPIAGQGFNQSMKDIACLTELMKHQASLGLDIGDASLLSQYDRQRRVDNLTMIAATDGLNRLFSNSRPATTALRRVGLGLVQKLPGVKKAFMRHAMTVKKSA